MKKVLSVLLSVVLLFGIFNILPISVSAQETDIVEVGTQSKSSNFASGYSITGNGASDMVSIASRQIGRSQGNFGYTEGWCADFVCDCAKIAGQNNAVPFYGGVGGLKDRVIDAGGTTVSSPKAGDLVFYYAGGGWAHVGIMTDGTNYISGNMWTYGYSQVEKWSYTSYPGYSAVQFVRPNYKNSVHTHNYNTYVYYWAAHPHYNCYKCSCGEVKENRNETRPLDTCSQCIAEYKPYASISKEVYHVEENVTVSWNKIKNATHYNVRLYKVEADGSGKLYDTTFNITDTSYTFSSLVPGDYYLFVQTYNKYYWMSDNSDYFHSQGDKICFSVIDEHTPTATAQYGESSYEYYNYQMSWLEALKFCERRGGHLAVINSAEENEIVYRLAKPYTTYAWLGGTDDVKEGNWYWINSDEFYYSNWNPGEPNNDSNIEHCLELMTSDNHPGQWNDVPYNSTRVTGFICEYEDNRAIDLSKYQPVSTQEYNGKTYEVYYNNLDWQTAKLVCERKGGHLVIIDDANENTFVGNLITSGSKDEYWLGISDYMDEGNWVTVLGNKVPFTKWTSGEPSNSWNVEDYAVIKKNSDWNDVKEYSGLYRNVGFICEYEPKKVTLGDADGDGTVGSIDVTQIMRVCAQIDTGIDEDVMMNADVDGNSVLEIIDATYIQRYLAMMNTPYAIGETK